MWGVLLSPTIVVVYLVSCFVYTEYREVCVLYIAGIVWEEIVASLRNRSPFSPTLVAANTYWGGSYVTRCCCVSRAPHIVSRPPLLIALDTTHSRTHTHNTHTLLHTIILLTQYTSYDSRSYTQYTQCYYTWSPVSHKRTQDRSLVTAVFVRYSPSDVYLSILIQLSQHEALLC